MTTSKWDFFDESEKSGNAKKANLTSYDDDDNDQEDDEDIDGKPMEENEEETTAPLEPVNNPVNLYIKENIYDEEKRKALREIEVNLINNILVSYHFLKFTN